MATAKMAEIKDARIKCMVWGDSGTGKSRFGLSAINPLVIDTEDSTTLYAKEFMFLVARIEAGDIKTRTPLQLTLTIIDEIEKGMYPDMKTLVVDCFTDVLDEIESVSAKAYEKNNNIKSIDTLNQLAKTKWYSYRRESYRRIIDKLKALPCNLVLVCRSKDVWAMSEGKMQPIGKTYDAHELTEWLMDVVIKLEKDEKGIKGIVSKSRIGNLPKILDIDKGYQNIVDALEGNDTKNKTAKKGDE